MNSSHLGFTWAIADPICVNMVCRQCAEIEGQGQGQGQGALLLEALCAERIDRETLQSDAEGPLVGTGR